MALIQVPKGLTPEQKQLYVKDYLVQKSASRPTAIQQAMSESTATRPDGLGGILFDITRPIRQGVVEPANYVANQLAATLAGERTAGYRGGDVLGELGSMLTGSSQDRAMDLVRQGYRPSGAVTQQEFEDYYNKPGQTLAKNMLATGSYFVPGGSLKNALIGGAMGGAGYAEQGQELQGALGGALTGGALYGAGKIVGKVGERLKKAKVEKIGIGGDTGEKVAQKGFETQLSAQRVGYAGNNPILRSPQSQDDFLIEYNKMIKESAAKPNLKSVADDFNISNDKWNLRDMADYSNELNKRSGKAIDKFMEIDGGKQNVPSFEEYLKTQGNKVYHGTGSGGFKAFDEAKIGTGVDRGLTGRGDYGQGFYVTPNKKDALSYAKKAGGKKPTVMEVFINNKAPLDLRIRNKIDAALTKEIQNGGYNRLNVPQGVYDKVFAKYGVTEDVYNLMGDIANMSDDQGYFAPDMKAAAEKLGFDSIIAPNGEVTIFNKGDIKTTAQLFDDYNRMVKSGNMSGGTIGSVLVPQVEKSKILRETLQEMGAGGMDNSALNKYIPVPNQKDVFLGDVWKENRIIDDLMANTDNPEAILVYRARKLANNKLIDKYSAGVQNKAFREAQKVYSKTSTYLNDFVPAQFSGGSDWMPFTPLQAASKATSGTMGRDLRLGAGRVMEKVGDGVQVGGSVKNISPQVGVGTQRISDVLQSPLTRGVVVPISQRQGVGVETPSIQQGAEQGGLLQEILAQDDSYKMQKNQLAVRLYQSGLVDSPNEGATLAESILTSQGVQTPPELTTKTRGELASLQSSLQQLDELQQLIGQSQGSMGVVGGRFENLSSMLGGGAFKSQMEKSAQVFAKALEGGKLTDKDVVRYIGEDGKSGMLPSIYDNPDTANTKIESLKREIQQQMLNKYYSGQ